MFMLFVVSILYLLIIDNVKDCIFVSFFLLFFFFLLVINQNHTSASPKKFTSENDYYIKMQKKNQLFYIPITA